MANNFQSEAIEIQFISRQQAQILVARRDILMDVKTWLVLSTYAAGGELIPTQP